MDKFHSLYQCVSRPDSLRGTVTDTAITQCRGRAVVFPRSQLRVKSSLRDRYEELEQWVPYAYPGAIETWITTAYSVTTWEALHELCAIVVSANLGGVVRLPRHTLARS
jgi:hypothetical protein